jgi:hypothetical protein
VLESVPAVERVSNEAIVFRGRRNRPEDIQRGTDTHLSGVTRVSVECAVGLTIEALAVTIPHKKLGSRTVSELRKAGGDVIRSSGRSLHHATLTALRS